MGAADGPGFETPISKRDAVMGHNGGQARFRGRCNSEPAVIVRDPQGFG